MSAFADLAAHERETGALAQIAGRLGWDQETMMPPGAAAQRGEEAAALESVLHARRADPRRADLLARAEAEGAPDDAGAAILREVRRSLTRALRVPGDLAAELARVTSLSQGIWARARAAEDVAAFLPTLARVVALRREEAAALAAGGDPYDALLDGYEPGATGAAIAAMFDRMRPRLVALRERVLGADQPPALRGRFPAEAQLRIAREMAGAFGYDFERGRLDMAVHPFSSGSGADVRITTRVVETDPFNCLYSTIHEVGHACYEQAVAPDYALSPIGQGASMGVHESQSRIYENQLGRSPAFTAHLFGRMRAHFGDDLLPGDADSFCATVNRVSPGFIRTEADEVHYNLHIMMRFDLERRLISGALDVADLEEAWNARFADDFGIAVDRPSNGMLQDVHWSIGLFGYFPTYTLGNLYAGCLHRALRANLPGLDDDLARGDLAAATGWLRHHVQRHGALLPPGEVIAQACGFAPGPEPLLDYLDDKFTRLYRL